MTREEISSNLWEIAQKEVRSQGFQFSIQVAGQVRELIHHGVFSNMSTDDINNGRKIIEAEHNLREICQELCRREHRRQQRNRIIDSRTFTEARFQFCPRYPFC